MHGVGSSDFTCTALTCKFSQQTVNALHFSASSCIGNLFKVLLRQARSQTFRKGVIKMYVIGTLCLNLVAF